MLRAVAWRRKVRGAGWGLVCIGVPLLVAAWNTGSNLFYVLVGGLVSFAVLSSVLSRLNLRKLVVHREAPASVFRLETFFTRVSVSNPRKLTPVVSLRVQIATGTDAPAGFAPVIPAGRVATLEVAHCCSRRGVQTLPGLELASRYPFGLGEVRRQFMDTSEVVVYPRVLPLRVTVLELLSGLGRVPTPVRDTTNEYFSLREYLVGDDVRRIAWKASARLRKWMVREHQQEISREIVLDFNTRVSDVAELAEETFEEAVELVASLAVAFLEQSFFVSVVTPDGALPLGAGRAHVVRALEFLARLEPRMRSEDEAPTGSGTGSPPGRAVIYISADAGQWGASVGGRLDRVLNPREVVRA